MCVCLRGDLLGLREKDKIYCLDRGFFPLFFFFSPLLFLPFPPRCQAISQTYWNLTGLAAVFTRIIAMVPRYSQTRVYD